MRWQSGGAPTTAVSNLTVVTMPLMWASRRSRHTGHVGSSVCPGAGSCALLLAAALLPVSLPPLAAALLLLAPGLPSLAAAAAALLLPRLPSSYCTSLTNTRRQMTSGSSVQNCTRLFRGPAWCRCSTAVTYPADANSLLRVKPPKYTMAWRPHRLVVALLVERHRCSRRVEAQQHEAGGAGVVTSHEAHVPDGREVATRPGAEVRHAHIRRHRQHRQHVAPVVLYKRSSYTSFYKTLK